MTVGLITLTAVLLLALPVQLLLIQLLPELPPVRAIAAETLLFLLPALLLRPTEEKQSQLKRPVLSAGAALAAGAAAQWLSALLALLWQGLTGLAAEGIPAEAGAPLTMLVVAVLLPAIAEELFFRGAIFERLQGSLGTIPAALLTGLTFALMHSDLPVLPAHLAVALLLSVIRAATGSVGLCILTHIGYNLCASVVALVSADFTAVTVAAVLLLAGALTVLLCRPMKRVPAKRPDERTALLAVIAVLASLIGFL